MSEKSNGCVVYASDGDQKTPTQPQSDEVETLPTSRLGYTLSDSDKIPSIGLDPEKTQVISEHVVLHHVSGAPAIWVQMSKYVLEGSDKYRLLIAPSVKFQHELPFIFKKEADDGMELIVGLAENIPLVLGWVMEQFPDFPFLDDVGEGEVEK